MEHDSMGEGVERFSQTGTEADGQRRKQAIKSKSHNTSNPLLDHTPNQLADFFFSFLFSKKLAVAVQSLPYVSN